VSGRRLAAAVTAGGGLGMIGAGNTIPPEWIAAEAGRARDAGREDQLAAADGAREELSAARKRGDYDIAYQYAGQAVGLVTGEHPAAEVVAGLAAGAERLLRGWQ
jgi:NAD(P)H-dependent flavin oxidoreductase YrpB (nitropropane dioxygenase family)